MDRVHLLIGRAGTPACKAGSQWSSSTVSGTRGHRKVSCLNCMRTHHYRSVRAEEKRMETKINKRLPKRIKLERGVRATHEQLGAPMWALVAAGGDHVEAKRLMQVRRLQRTRGNVRVVKRRVAPTAVGKRLVDEQDRTSIPRALAVGAGMGAIAWGGSRSRTLGRAMRSGMHNPELDPSVRRALGIAERTRHSIEATTTPLGRITGRGIGRMPKPLRDALDEVPKPLRPATATLAGAILVQHARPVRQQSYTPVVMY